jgi:O-antigen/teichoic acid export membrane protein
MPARGGLLRTLLARNGILIPVFTLVGLLQWVFIKLVALAQEPAEFGRFVAITFLGIILTAPLATLQSGVSRQVTTLAATGRGGAIPAYLRGLLARWALPLLAVVAVLLLAAGPLARGLRLDRPASVRLLTAIVVGNLPFQVMLGALAGRERIRSFAGVLLADASIRCGVALVAPGTIETTAGALAVYLGSLAAATLLGGLLLGRDLLTRGGEGTGRELRPVLPAFIVGAVLFYAVAFEDALLARVVLDDAGAGRYGAAVTLGRLLHMIPVPMIPILVPLVARLRAEGRSARRVLAFQLFLVFSVAFTATAAGLLRPDLVGGVILDPAKHSDLGALVPLALGAAGLFAMTNLMLNYLLALRWFGVLWIMAVAVAAGAALVLTAPPDPLAVMSRMAGLAGALFVVVLVLAFRRSGAEAP